MKNTILILFAAMWVLGLQSACSQRNGAQEGGLPDIEVKNMDSVAVSARSFHNDGKPFIVTFWYPNVPLCNHQLDDLAALRAQTGVKVYAVSISSDAEANKKHIASKAADRGWDFVFMYDGEALLIETSGESQYLYPYTVFCDKDGKIVTRKTGITYKDELFALYAPIAGEEIVPATAEAPANPGSSGAAAEETPKETPVKPVAEPPAKAAPTPVVAYDPGATINGTIWATRNVGAKGKFVANPEDYGNLYTWEEAQNACPYGWRLPTFKELYNDLERADDHRWTTLNGVNGRRFRKIHEIFLPAAGYINIKGQTDIRYRGTIGYYWSSEYHSYLAFYDSDAIVITVIEELDGLPPHRQSVRCVKK